MSFLAQIAVSPACPYAGQFAKQVHITSELSCRADACCTHGNPRRLPVPVARRGQLQRLVMWESYVGTAK